jgi:tetratricopeptide (TPR) repeat protein
LRRLTARFVLALALTSATALAAPTLWQRAADPSARTEARLLAALERTLDAREQTGGDPDLSLHLAQAAVAMIDLSPIREPKDPRLAVVMARSLLLVDSERAAEARRLLEGALPHLPDGSLAAAGWHSLGIAYALLEDAARAREAHTRGITLEWDSDRLASHYYNRAEEAARLLDFDAAISDYERAATLGTEPDVQALARFGLAVVLERRGDLPAAYAALDRALAVRLPVPPYPSEDPLELPGVFFVPAYERHYLQALAAMALARKAERTVERRALYALAVAEWDAYLDRAAENEPWIENAKSHRARSRKGAEEGPPARRPRSGH